MSARDNKCTVYKSGRKRDHYLFLSADLDVEDLPKGLLELLGNLEVVIELDLASRTGLASADITQVRQHLSDTGYYLQMPIVEVGDRRGDYFVPETEAQ